MDVMLCGPERSLSASDTEASDDIFPQGSSQLDWALPFRKRALMNTARLLFSVKGSAYIFWTHRPVMSARIRRRIDLSFSIVIRNFLQLGSRALYDLAVSFRWLLPDLLWQPETGIYRYLSFVWFVTPQAEWGIRT